MKMGTPFIPVVVLVMLCLIWNLNKATCQTNTLFADIGVVEDFALYAKVPVRSKREIEYSPSGLEKEMMERSYSLRYASEGINECDLFLNKSREPMYSRYREFMLLMQNYSKAVANFQGAVEDLRILPSRKIEEQCRSVDIVNIVFPARTVLSKTRSGYVEPLLPPLRHPRFCERHDEFLLSLEYLVHDFSWICNTLKPTSQTVFFDLGASLIFHEKKSKIQNPALALVDLYQRFGIKFDHYYAFEYTVIDPNTVFQSIPSKLLASYHWFNVPVSGNQTSKQNPWVSLLSQYNEDDFVVIKLDVDNPKVEIQLVKQLIQEENARRVDQFYFEHHVNMSQMGRHWRETAKGTLQDSLDLFTRLRQVGIAAHSWV